jgi:hypothetical protein
MGELHLSDGGGIRSVADDVGFRSAGSAFDVQSHSALGATRGKTRHNPASLSHCAALLVYGLMRITHATTFALACVMAVGLGAGAFAAPRVQRSEAQGGQVPAQGRGRGGGLEVAGPPQGPNDVPVVEVVGCLAQAPGNGWMVTNATEPVKAPVGFSKVEDLKAAETQALGTLQFRLIGLVEFAPADHKGHKVVVKGLWIKDANDPRLNVTSLMTASAACT